MRVWILSLLISSLMVACSSGSDQSKATAVVEPPAHKIAEHDREVLDSAKQLSDSLDQAAEEEKKKIDAQTE